MGLDSFKTEGPRSYKKDDKNVDKVGEESIHIVNGMEEPEVDELEGRSIHTVFRIEKTSKLTIPSGPPYFVCEDCGRVASTYRAIISPDIIDIDKDIDEADLLNQLVGNYKNTDENYYVKNAFESTPSSTSDDDIAQEVEDMSDGSDDSGDNEEESEDFNSGLGSFTS